MEGSPGAVVILTALLAVIILKNRGKAEHTDIWEKADQAVVEKSTAQSSGTTETEG